MEPVSDIYLAPTAVIDSDSRTVREYARVTAGNAGDPEEKAIRLFYAVRDGIWYDPYTPFHRPEHYRASAVLERGRAFCIPKAALLCALGRACGIPSRIGFATVRNHLATRQLLDFIGTDLFVYHGYTEFLLGDRWVKATPTFNRELCIRHRVAPLAFDGRTDAVFQAYNGEKRQFMEYVDDHGVYPDVPVETVVAAWKKVYGRDRVEKWIADLEAAGTGSIRRFETEDVVS
jgi:transglutaminase-like putative cysteine protease